MLLAECRIVDWHRQCLMRQGVRWFCRWATPRKT